MKKNILLLVFSLLALFTEGFAQNVEMADGLRSSGKIYVVVAVLCIIFIGIVVYLISIDGKLKKLKKDIEQSKL